MTLILMVHLWKRRQPVSGAQTHMSCTALLNLSLIVMIQAIPHTIHIAHFSWVPRVYNVCTLVYKSNKVDRIYISITMGKVDGCRLWSPRLTGGRVYPDYPCPHRERINVHVSTRRSTPFSYCSRTQAIDPLHPGLWKQFHRQTKEKDILGLSLNYRMTRPYAHVLYIKLLRLKPQYTSHAYTIAKKKYGYSSILYAVSTFCLLLFCASTWAAEFVCVVEKVR